MLRYEVPTPSPIHVPRDEGRRVFGPVRLGAAFGSGEENGRIYLAFCARAYNSTPFGAIIFVTQDVTLCWESQSLLA